MSKNMERIYFKRNGKFSGMRVYPVGNGSTFTYGFLENKLISLPYEYDNSYVLPYEEFKSYFTGTNLKRVRLRQISCNFWRLY